MSIVYGFAPILVRDLERTGIKPLWNIQENWRKDSRSNWSELKGIGNNTNETWKQIGK